MKKKIKKESGPSRIDKVEENIRTKRAEESARKAKTIKDLCDKMVWLFDMPANQGLDGSDIELSNLIDQISPWQKYVGEEQGVFEKVWEGVKIFPRSISLRSRTC
jgi:hypothetical protein